MVGHENSCNTTYCYLEKLHIQYRKLTDSTYDSISGEKTCEALGFLPSEVFKSILVHSIRKKHHNAIILLPANRKIDLEKVNKTLRTACSLASKKWIHSICSDDVGLFGPFSQASIPVYLDSSAVQMESIVINAGGAGNYIQLAVSDLISAAHATLADLSSGFSVELYGKNRPLPLNSVINNFQIRQVRCITPVEIFYEAKNIMSGEIVDICEFFPRSNGYYALRDRRGVKVCWKNYTNDMYPVYSDDLHFEAKKKYFNKCFRNAELNSQVLTKFISGDTYYIVYRHISGNTLQDLVDKEGHVSWDILRFGFFELLDKVCTRNYSTGTICPDTVYFDLNTGRADFLTFCSPTNLFGSLSLQFMPTGNYPWVGLQDITALFTLLCYALGGKMWVWNHYGYYGNWDDVVKFLETQIPKADMILLKEKTINTFPEIWEIKSKIR